jgi:zinc/manganese transport system ATP-binding protein
MTSAKSGPLSKPKSDPTRSSTPRGDESVAVKLVDATAVIAGRAIWSDVSLTVNSGNFVAILGPNGAGKSTLLKVILGELSLANGFVSVFGEHAGKHNRQVGYLPQRRTFDANVRIRGVDLVRLGLDGARWGTPIPLLSRLISPSRYRHNRDRVDTVIELVGASAYAKRPIGECSGGEQQRLLIAQALIRNPKLLILDEPLDSLDVPSQAGISALIHNICRIQHVAVLMVAHDINPILSYLDEVIYLARGKAIMGTPESVITSETLSTLYDTPIDVLRDRSGRLVVVGQPDLHAEHPAGESR